MIKIIFLIGKPAAGKDVQANLLIKKIKIKKIVASEELKKFFKKNNLKYLKIGKIKINLKKQKEKINKGKLASYRLISFLLTNIILKSIRQKQSIIFSGSPRSIYEAKTYLKILKNFKDVKYYFIYLKVKDKTVIERALKRYYLEKRIDDAPQIVKVRLRVFKKEIQPMIEFLKAKNKLIEINGEKKVEEVNKEILKAIS